MVNNRVVMITGASAGIGHATALAFARHGDRVAALARRTRRLHTLADSCEDMPGEILPITADVTRQPDLERAVRETTTRWGHLDVLVANAGLGHRGGLVDAEWRDLETVLRVNIEGVLHSVRAAVPAMRMGRRGGHIILISSISGVAPAPFAAMYGASKSFVNGLARALRYELNDEQIWVTNFIIGQTHSDFAENRLGQPGRVASKLPTMTAEQVAQRIVWASTRRRRAVIMRPLDTLFVLGATFAPGVMDRLQKAVYK